MADDDAPLGDDEARIDAILRSMDSTDLDLVAPPDTVWAGIQSELGEAGDVHDASDSAPVVSLDARRRRPALLAVAVAAALVIVAGLAVVLVSDGGADPVEVASAELTHVDGDPGFVELGVGRSAEVTLIEESDAELVRVDVADLPAVADDSDLEIWLIGVSDGEIEIVQTLGIVADPAAPGTFQVPDDFDRSAYEAVAVDISVEPHDGDEAHSGMSLVRGTLTA